MWVYGVSTCKRACSFLMWFEWDADLVSIGIGGNMRSKFPPTFSALTRRFQTDNCTRDPINSPLFDGSDTSTYECLGTYFGI
jgi:hypothetical protein